uniref:Uncharacterized protein ORF-c20_035 n=1 Tax=Saccharolobus solfataricus TaxID=2287 RepID=Q9UXD1_SACSO|nr:hypothetical protein [Saccharolobus solfataricus P2]
MYFSFNLLMLFLACGRSLLFAAIIIGLLTDRKVLANTLRSCSVHCINFRFSNFVTFKVSIMCDLFTDTPDSLLNNASTRSFPDKSDVLANLAQSLLIIE